MNNKKVQYTDSESGSLSVFSFDNFNVRTIIVDGEPFFCLADVLRVIQSKTTVTAAKESIVEGLGDGFVIFYPILDQLNRMQDTLFIHEAAITFLVTWSRTDAGKRLNLKIHKEILPSIRKTGSYSVDGKRQLASTLEQEAIALIKASHETFDVLDQTIKRVEDQKEVLLSQALGLDATTPFPTMEDVGRLELDFTDYHSLECYMDTYGIKFSFKRLEELDEMCLTYSRQQRVFVLYFLIKPTRTSYYVEQSTRRHYQYHVDVITHILTTQGMI